MTFTSRFFSAFLFLLTTILGAASADERFTVHFSSTQLHWNPHYAYTTTEAQVFNALHEGLVTFHPTTLRPIPGAAESWTVSEDGLVYTFTLRENLRWSNGDQITSQDFADSWLTILSPGTGSEYASLLDGIAGARDFRTGRGPESLVSLETPNDRTLVVTLEEPSPQFLSILCHYSFSPLHRDFRKVQDWSTIRSIPVSGPFVIRARSEEEVLLDKNPEYWDADSVALSGIRLLFSDDAAQATDDFNRYQIDWLVSGMDTSRLALPEALNMSPLFSTTYFYFSNHRSPWSDPKVRRALAMLVPWEEIRANLLTPGTTLVPPIPNYPQASAGFPAVGERLSEAMELLDEAGFPGGEGLGSLVIRIPGNDQTVEIMKSAWESALSLEVMVDVVPFPHYYGSLKSDDYDLATLTWTGDYADPMTFLGMWEAGSSFNDAGYHNPIYDGLLREAARLPYLQRLMKLKEAEDILLRDGQVLPVEHFPAVNLIDLRFLEGWFPNALDIHPFKNIVPVVGFDIPGAA